MRRVWEKFTCINCGWITFGTYQYGHEILPDTDCPKCGSHDSVRGDDGDHPEPEDIKALIRDQSSGPFAW